jgi:predicted enzyme related to lactoylglutathione lyase
MSPPVEISVNIDVPDLEAAIEFYRLALGLHLGRRLFEGSVAEMVGASSKIYLLMKPAGESASSVARLPRAYDRHWTPVHFDFVVGDVLAAVERAVASGAKLESTIQSFDWGRLAVLSDPFGHGFCLLQFTGRGYDEVT